MDVAREEIDDEVVIVELEQSRREDRRTVEPDQPSAGANEDDHEEEGAVLTLENGLDLCENLVEGFSAFAIVRSSGRTVVVEWILACG